MIATLGMYDRAETSAANDRFWAGIRDRLRAAGIAAPDALTRGAGAFWAAWEAPDLVLSQTCGLPFRAKLHGKVTLIGTPDYGLEGCPPGHYRSVLVVRANDPRPSLTAFANARFAYSDAMSQSGWAAPQTHAAGLGFRFQPGLASGGHRLSALAVAEGRADIAAIDALSWQMLVRWDGFATALRVVDATAPTPGLPYISAAAADGPALFRAVAAAIAVLSAQDRDTLHLKGIVAIPAAAYLAVPNPPAPGQIAQNI